MNERARTPVSAQMLAAFVDGEVTPSEADQVEGELAESVTARRQLAELRRIRETLSGPVSEVESMDLVAAVRARIAAGEPPARRRVSAWKFALAASLAAACALALVQITPEPVSIERARSPTSDVEFRVKSDARSGATRWAGIQAFSVAGDAPPQPLTGRLSRPAGLLFSYTNLGPEPFEYLMIFLADARGAVHWCFPAYQALGTNPASLRIQKGEAMVPLAELIHVTPAPGPALLYALFSMQPLKVLEVEAWLQRPRAERGPEHGPGTFHQVFQLEVEP